MEQSEAMLVHIPNVLIPDQILAIRQALDAASWTDGKATAGTQAAQVKRNRQLASGSELAVQLGTQISEALLAHPMFMSAVLPAKLTTPLFNRYEGGEHYGNHVDSAFQNDPRPGGAGRIRSDVSTTVFLCDLDEYDGGELIVEDSYGAHEVKLAAGDAIVYPSSSLHRVEPVTRGTRLASFLWTQSMVRDQARRSMLFNLDMTILRLRQQHGDTDEVVALTAHYHNLLRMWSEL
jgi:PKHD-type hydroxylase